MCINVRSSNSSRLQHVENTGMLIILCGFDTYSCKKVGEMSGVTCLRWQVHFVITPFTAAKFQPWSTSVAGAYQAAIANFSSLAAQEGEIDRSVFQLDATVEERRDFQSDCELQPVPSQIWVLKEDNALPCDLLMQTSRHNFISTLSKKFSHTLRSLTKFFSIQNWVLLPY